MLSPARARVSAYAMFKLLHYGHAWVSALGASRIGVLDPIRQELRAWPWWCDALGHVNHAKYLELATLGRLAWLTRLGVLHSLVRERYVFLIAGTALTYRREIPLMSKFTMETQAVAYDARWLCFSTTFTRADQIAARMVIRGQVRNRRGDAANTALVERFGIELPPIPVLPTDVAAQLAAQDAAVDFIRVHDGR